MDWNPGNTPEVGVSVRESIDPDSSLWAWLAFDLWFYRTRRGLSLAQTAQIARVARGTVSNWEAGRLRPSDPYMAILDQTWDTGGHFQRLLHYARSGHDPDWFAQYIQYESAAKVLKIYHGKSIPVPVQTPEYAKALLLSGGQARQSDREVEARRKRQEILTKRDPPYIWIILDEDVLERPVGTRSTMEEQLGYLLQVDELPHVSVRCILRAAGAHPGLDGAFQILDLGGRQISYAGAQLAGRLIEAGDEVATLAIHFDQLGALALSRDDSRRLIEKVRESYL
ncbi:Scr1 family TA system antitoxin-like transcriptional regulator [Actinomadura sp. NPDC000600]|uniref:Scr1 family TA system antitoxin-like transcriptional regulator n=1 Tax=Actinomadura sp. NPDC000600 TaxID=3154262 RepID=UPI0033919353